MGGLGPGGGGGGGGGEGAFKMEEVGKEESLFVCLPPALSARYRKLLVFNCVGRTGCGGAEKLGLLGY